MLERYRGVASRLFPAAILCLLPGLSAAYLDLSQAGVETLENGLTVIILEEHSFPVVSVQMLYRTGARDESVGKTGLAHFVEHMAFRHSENFPGYRLTGAIEAVGGEWHGYTWLDQTTYFATVPATEMELLIRIEADRMSKVIMDASEVESERGSVLSELYGYENDPASVLHDNVLYLSFLAHPYRNNTIGWDSDVAHINHADLVDFYAQQYHPGNAVLAVVGDVNRDEVMRLVRLGFADLPGRARTGKPHTVEPSQNGERRIRLLGAPERKFLEIAYRAPSVHSGDFAAFLLVQDLLAAGSGINFLENDWVTPARPDSMLAGISDDIATWFPPSDQEYAFTIKATMAGDADEAKTEAAIEAAIERLRQQFSEENETSRTALEKALGRVRRALLFDIRTTEDAAHQLAFFAGIDALDILINLPDLLQEVSVEHISRVMDRYLRPEQKTTGWYVPGTAASVREIPTTPTEVQTFNWSPSDAKNPTREKAGPAVFSRLSNGLPVIVQHSALTPTATFKVVATAAEFTIPDGVGLGAPAKGLLSLDFDLLPGELERAASQARDIVGSASALAAENPAGKSNPGALLTKSFDEILGAEPAKSQPGVPLLLVITGDIDAATALQTLENHFADLPSNPWTKPDASNPPPLAIVEKRTEFSVAQEMLGYIAQVPKPSEKVAAAWQMVLYLFNNGYGGRLGSEAIGQRGLVYYIDASYQTDGRNDWITLGTGVDPAKHGAMRSLLTLELARLLTEPPSQSEIDEARAHLLGRAISAAQSNPELADSLAQQWILNGKLLEYADYQRLLNQVSRQDILEQLPAFTRGTVVSVRNPQAD